MITMKTTNGEWKKNINSNLIQMFRFVVLSVCLYSNSGMLQCENMNEINGIKSIWHISKRLEKIGFGVKLKEQTRKITQRKAQRRKKKIWKRQTKRIHICLRCVFTPHPSPRRIHTYKFSHIWNCMASNHQKKTKKKEII